MQQFLSLWEYVKVKFYTKTMSMIKGDLILPLTMLWKISTIIPISICTHDLGKYQHPSVWSNKEKRSWPWCYSKVSFKLPVLLNDLVWIIPKSLYQTTRSIAEKNDRTLLFQGCHGHFLGSIKQPGLDIWKKSLLNNQYYLFFKF